MGFFLSAIGQYFWQSIFHSFLIAVIVEVIMKSGRVREPLTQVKFRLLSLGLPVLYLPVLYFLFPARAGTSFHQNIALFDSNQWFGLSPGGFALWYLAAAAVVLTVFFFLSSELIPVVSFRLARRLSLPVMVKGQFLEVDSLLASLSRKSRVPEPEVLVSAEMVPSVYTLGRRALVLSLLAIRLLDAEELEAVMAHEIAHFTRRVLVISWVGLVLRCLMFYNPVALLVYHRINSDTEKLCDDLAISFSGKRLALASGLLKILRRTTVEAAAAQPAGGKRWLPFKVKSLEDQAHLAMVKERAERLLHGDKVNVVLYRNQRIAVTAGLLMLLLFFVV